MSGRAEELVRNELIRAWGRTKTELLRVNSTFAHRPVNDYDVIGRGEESDEETVLIGVGPLAMRVPERGDSRKDLFIYFHGSIGFSRRRWSVDKRLEITSIASRIAYFRHASGGSLDLVFGGHYDYAPDLQGHPVFHAQVDGSLQEFGEFVGTSFGIEGSVTNSISGTLRNVRIPSAQLDAFSCMLQIAADHLLPRNPTVGACDAFNSLRSDSALCGPSCQGEQPLPAINAAEHRCFRARHWYPPAPTELAR